ncbi:MAG: polysaccharide deacetylase family protein, partial [Candidatus Bathyarchaeia archaeon]
MSTGKRPIVHVLLTFDVEEAEYGGQLDLKTQRVVGALKEFGPPPATFFLDGAATLTYPNSVRLLAENGFELALHSDYHPDVGARHHRKMDFGSQDSKTQISRIQNAISMIRSVIPDFDPRGFRSPNWSWNEDLYFSLNKLGFLYDSS